MSKVQSVRRVAGGSELPMVLRANNTDTDPPRTLVGSHGLTPPFFLDVAFPSRTIGKILNRGVGSGPLLGDPRSKIINATPVCRG